MRDCPIKSQVRALSSASRRVDGSSDGTIASGMDWLVVGGFQPFGLMKPGE